MGEKRNTYRIFVGKSEGKRPLGRQCIGGWTILKWIMDRMGEIGLICLRIGTSGGLL
jgi:hypothetical protein